MARRPDPIGDSLKSLVDYAGALEAKHDDDENEFDWGSRDGKVLTHLLRAVDELLLADKLVRA